VVGIRYDLQVANVAVGAVAFAEFVWGFIVGFNPTTPGDVDPLLLQHRSWMEWGRKTVSLGANNVFTPLVGGGDEGFRTVRSKRRMNEVEDDLLFVIKATTAGPFQYTMISTVALMLP